MVAANRQLPQLNEIAIESKFINRAEHSALLDWAESEFAAGHLDRNQAGPFRYFNRYEKGSSVPDLFWRVRDRAVSNFSVTDYEDEPKFKCFLGCNIEGGFVRRHTDPSPPEKHHVRMNIMLSKPIAGGEPMIDGKLVDVDERDMWCFFPGIMHHSSTPVIGTKHRFVLSIGILVPRNLRFQ
jgi:hypothetical protein